MIKYVILFISVFFLLGQVMAGVGGSHGGADKDSSKDKGSKNKYKIEKIIFLP